MFAPHMLTKKIKMIFEVDNDIHVPSLNEPLQWNMRQRNTGQSLPSLLLGDEQRFKQVLINLIKNSLKFTTYGSITITTGFKNGRITVYVRDTGYGIDQHALMKLSRKFSKPELSAKLSHDGFGLGLTIVKKIVELGEGNVSVHSQGIGHGSLFTFDMKMEELQVLTIQSDDE